jgi:hypothetical protein
MKIITSLLAVAVVGLGIQSASAALILTTQFDATFDDALTAPFVGNATLSYSAGSPLADGVYAWNSFSGLSFSASFPDVGSGVTFNETHLLSSDVYVAIVGSSFFFANPNSDANSPYSGSADFSNGTYYLTTEPVNNSTLSSDYRGTAFSYPLYQLSLVADGSFIYGGSYGADRQLATVGGGGDPAAVPEPGQVAASLLLLSGIGGYVFLKRRKAAKAAEPALA